MILLHLIEKIFHFEISRGFLKLDLFLNLRAMCSFKLFSSSKIVFWPFLKLQKMEFGEKNFVKPIYLISRVFFWPGVFKFSGPVRYVRLQCSAQ